MLLFERQNLPNAYALLAALGSRDYGALNLAYRVLIANGHEPQRLKRRLRHWTIISSIDRAEIAAGAKVLADLDLEALVPVSGRFPDPALAHLVAALVPVWEKVTGRTAGLVSIDNEGDKKKCPVADWLGEMHDFLRVPSPPAGRVVDIVRSDLKKSGTRPQRELPWIIAHHPNQKDGAIWNQLSPTSRAKGSD